MRKFIIWTAIVFSFLSFAIPVRSASINPPTNNTVPIEDFSKKISSMKIKDMQKLLGRKLTLKEKIAFVVFKHQVKHRADSGSDPGKKALTFSLIGAALLVLGLFIPYVILGSVIAAVIGIIKGSAARKQNSSDKNASSAVLLGWITLGLFALLLILAAIIIAASDWSWF